MSFQAYIDNIVIKTEKMPTDRNDQFQYSGVYPRNK